MPYGTGDVPDLIIFIKGYLNFLLNQFYHKYFFYIY
jgi:hypothetical protein